MSLRGRYVIDRMKRSIGNYLRFPVPPYHHPNYWEDVYKKLSPSDVFEWGNFDCEDILEYSCRQKQYDMKQLLFLANQNDLVQASLSSRSIEQTSTGLADSLQIAPHETKEEPILLLGCGNSMLGEDMLRSGWKGPLLGVDVSSRLIHDLSRRNADKSYNIRFIQDDATSLSALEDGTVSAAIDKGLIDAIFCTEHYDTCQEILQSVHRVMKPGGAFCCFSYSRPEFILQRVLSPSDEKLQSRRSQEQQLTKAWSTVQIQRLGFIYMYRFVKTSPPTANVRLQNKPKPSRRR